MGAVRRRLKWNAFAGVGASTGMPLTPDRVRERLFSLPLEMEETAGSTLRVAAYPGVVATGGSHPHPHPLPQGDLYVTRGTVARKTLTPTLSHREREQERPALSRTKGVVQRSLKGEGKNGA